MLILSGLVRKQSMSTKTDIETALDALVKKKPSNFGNLDKLRERYSNLDEVDLLKDGEFNLLLEIMSELYSTQPKGYEELINKVQKAIKTRQNEMTDTPRKEIHFSWLGKIGDIQLDYIRQWVKQYPDHQVTLWYDKNALLARELFIHIQKKANAEAASNISNTKNVCNTALVNFIIKYQNEAYKEITKELSKNKTFDDAVKLYLTTYSGATEEQLNSIIKANIESYNQSASYIQHGINGKIKFQLEEITKDTLFSDFPELYTYYIQELSLRQNLAAATDITRLLVLYKKGGYHIDADLLPPIDSKHSKIDEKNFKSDSMKTIPKTLNAAIALETLNKAGELRGRNARIEKYINTKILMSYYKNIHKDEINGTRARMIKAVNSNKLYMSIEDIKIPKRTGMKYFISSYPNDIRQDYNNNAIVAIHQSPLVKHILTQIKWMYEFVAKYKINGLDTPAQIPLELSSDMKEELKQGGFWSSAGKYGEGYSNILSYRFDGLSNEKTTATVFLTGPAMYLYAERSFLNVDYSQDRLLQVKFKMGLGFEKVTNHTEEDDLSTWIGSGMMEYRDVFSPSSRYSAQIIIQLEDDPVSELAASFLYNKNSLITKWVKYNPSTTELVVFRKANNFNIDCKGKKRVVILGHGKENPQSMGSQSAESISKLIKEVSPSNKKIERLSLIGCNLGNEILANKGELSRNGFIYPLLNDLKRLNVRINATSVRGGLVTVDVMGRKWTGEMNELTKIIDWSHKDTLRKFLIQKKVIGEGYKYKRVPSEKGDIERAHIIPVFNTGRFGLFHKLADEKLENEFLYFNKFESLENKTEVFAEEQLQTMLETLLRASKEGEVFVVADPVALLMGLSSENSHEIVICDRNLNKLHAIQTALRLAVTVSASNTSSAPTYEEWSKKIFINDEQLNVFNRLVKLMGSVNNESAFNELQKRIKENKFSFYHVDIANVDSYDVIMRDQSQSLGFTAYYLGNVEDFYNKLENDQAVNKAHLEDRLTNIKNNILKLKYSLEKGEAGLENQTEPQLFIYSACNNNEYYSKQSVNSFDFEKKYTSDEYIKSLMQKRDDLFEEISIIKRSQDLDRALGEIHGINDSSIPVYGGIEFDNTKKLWKVPFIDLKDPELKSSTFETRSDSFVNMFRFLNHHASVVNKKIPYSHGEFSNANNVEAVHGLNSAFALQFLLTSLKKDFVIESSSLSLSAKIHFYINVAMQGQGLVSDSLQAIDLTRKAIEEQNMVMKSGYGLFEKGLDKISMGIHRIGSILNIATLGLDIYELINEENVDLKSRAAFQLGLDASLLSINAASMLAGMVGMNILSTSLNAIGTPLMGLSIGGMALYNATEKVRQKTKACGNWLNQLYDEMKSGHAAEDGSKNNKIFSSPILAAVENINLSKDISIKLASQRYQRYENVGGAILSWLFFGKRPATGDQGYGQFLNTLSLNSTIVLDNRDVDAVIMPVSPNGYFDFSYGLELTANSSNIDYNPDAYPEYRTGKLLEKNDTGFLFTYHTVFDQAMHRIYPAYQESPMKINIVTGDRTLIFPWCANNETDTQDEHNDKKNIKETLLKKYKHMTYTVQAASASKQTIILPGTFVLRLCLLSNYTGNMKHN